MGHFPNGHSPCLFGSFSGVLANSNISYLPCGFSVSNVPPRWQKCADLIVRGKCVKEIAGELNISPKTVEFHLNVAKKKMGLTGAGYTPFFTSIIDKRKLDQIDFKLDQMAEHLKLALDILIELR